MLEQKVVESMLEFKIKRANHLADLILTDTKDLIYQSALQGIRNDLDDLIMLLEEIEILEEILQIHIVDRFILKRYR